MAPVALRIHESLSRFSSKCWTQAAIVPWLPHTLHTLLTHIAHTPHTHMHAHACIPHMIRSAHMLHITLACIQSPHTIQTHIHTHTPQIPYITHIIQMCTHHIHNTHNTYTWTTCHTCTYIYHIHNAGFSSHKKQPEQKVDA